MPGPWQLPVGSSSRSVCPSYLDSQSFPQVLLLKHGNGRQWYLAVCAPRDRHFASIIAQEIIFNDL
jgi:hypothetical protein